VKERIAQLAASAAHQPHGTRSRYNSGCHCFQCRVANTNYETARAAKHRAGWHARLVPTDKALAHLDALSQAGVGYKSVADAAGVSHTTLARVKYGRGQIRATTEARILAVDRGAMADGARIDAGPTLRLIAGMVRDGYTRLWIARQLGYKSTGLQFRLPTVSALNASRVERLYRRIEEGRVSR